MATTTIHIDDTHACQQTAVILLRFEVSANSCTIQAQVQGTD